MRARLILADGTALHGKQFGARSSASGEVVFNTGMVGYPESLTDPSYAGQILVYTYPLIGNYGVADRTFESEAIQVRGIIVTHYESHFSHWQGVRTLDAWLTNHHIPGISGIDTRALTKKLREDGVMLGQIVVGNDRVAKKIDDPNMRTIVKEVSCDKSRWYGHGRKQILLVDCGVKLSIITNFVQRGVRVKRVPWDYNYLAELDDFHGVVISNGPGDPMQCRETIAYAKSVLQFNKPFFGICLGSQIQGIACGAKTYKLPYGHRAQNQPCVLEGTKQCVLTSQNHGFAVAEHTLPKFFRVWYRNANDHSIEGIHHRSKPFFSVQFHPEAHPGPLDANSLFDYFVRCL